MTVTPKILMVASSKGLCTLAQKVAAEKNTNIDIVSRPMDEALKIALEYELQGIDCVISRGPTGVYLRAHLSVPVLLIQVTAFDILQALYRARKASSNLAYIDHVHRMNSYDLDTMLSLIGIGEIRRYYYCNLEMLEEQLQLAARDGVDTIVAPDDDVINLAEASGLRGIIVDSNYEAVAEAVARAKELTNLREKDRAANLFMKTIIDNYENALIVLDESQRISHINHNAEKLLSVTYNHAIGKDFSDLPGIDNDLVKMINGNNQLVNRVHNVHRHRVLFNTIPLPADSSFRGRIISIHRVSKIQQMEANIRRELYAKGLISRHSFDDLTGQSQAIKKAIGFAQSYATASSTVLISGESGTGKEIFAHSIHQASSRRNGPFVSVNCAAIPENLLESELFGYKEGAFTGAKRGGKPGLFEVAHGGTLLLDEVSEIPLHLQARLLRVLQEKALRRIGDDELTMVDVRVIASTNRDLLAMTGQGKFRHDLYYRLNVLNLYVPPLRERKNDIMLLVAAFYRKFSGSELPELPDDLVKPMTDYSWPGNVRELENFIERLVILTNGFNRKQFLAVMKNLVGENLNGVHGEPLNSIDKQEQHLLIKIDTMRNMENQIITKLKKQNNHSKKQLAGKLGISRTTLWKKIKDADQAINASKYKY